MSESFKNEKNIFRKSQKLGLLGGYFEQIYGRVDDEDSNPR